MKTKSKLEKAISENKVLSNKISIPIYENKNDKFEIVSEKIYTINYIKSDKKCILKIVVNGFLSNHKININNSYISYRHEILSAISEYEKLVDKNRIEVIKKFWRFSNLANYSLPLVNNIFHNIIAHLLPINKEAGRDNLTKYELINLIK